MRKKNDFYLARRRRRSKKMKKCLIESIIDSVQVKQIYNKKQQHINKKIQFE